MKRQILLAVIFVLISALLFSSCGSKEPANEVDGTLVEVKDDSGNLIGYERRYHNDHGDLSRVDEYDTSEEYLSFITYDYDSDYRLIQETHYRADGIGEYYYTYIYDENGNKVEMGYYTMREGAVRTLYDSEGSETERYTYDDEDNLIKHEVKLNGHWEAATEAETNSTAE